MNEETEKFLREMDELGRPALEELRRYLDSLSDLEWLRFNLKDPLFVSCLTEDELRQMREALAQLEAGQGKPG
jgi:hypothetical protein